MLKMDALFTVVCNLNTNKYSRLIAYVKVKYTGGYNVATIRLINAT